MKQLIHKSMAVSMAIVVLMTTMSFTVDMHYCGDTLVDFSFVQQVKTCGMKKATVLTSCEGSEFSKSSCCSDKQFVKQGTNDLKISFDQQAFEQQILIASYAYSYISLFVGTESKEIPFFDYAPPFIKQDVQILYQTFLI